MWWRPSLLLLLLLVLVALTGGQQAGFGQQQAGVQNAAHPQQQSRLSESTQNKQAQQQQQQQQQPRLQAAAQKAVPAPKQPDGQVAKTGQLQAQAVDVQPQKQVQVAVEPQGRAALPQHQGQAAAVQGQGQPGAVQGQGQFAAIQGQGQGQAAAVQRQGRRVPLQPKEVPRQPAQPQSRQGPGQIPSNNDLAPVAGGLPPLPVHQRQPPQQALPPRDGASLQFESNNVRQGQQVFQQNLGAPAAAGGLDSRLVQNQLQQQGYKWVGNRDTSLNQNQRAADGEVNSNLGNAQDKWQQDPYKYGSLGRRDNTKDRQGGFPVQQGGGVVKVPYGSSKNESGNQQLPKAVDHNSDGSLRNLDQRPDSILTRDGYREDPPGKEKSHFKTVKRSEFEPTKKTIVAPPKPNRQGGVEGSQIKQDFVDQGQGQGLHVTPAPPAVPLEQAVQGNFQDFAKLEGPPYQTADQRKNDLPKEKLKEFNVDVADIMNAKDDTPNNLDTSIKRNGLDLGQAQGGNSIDRKDDVGFKPGGVPEVKGDAVDTNGDKGADDDEDEYDDDDLDLEDDTYDDDVDSDPKQKADQPVAKKEEEVKENLQPAGVNNIPQQRAQYDANRPAGAWNEPPRIYNAKPLEDEEDKPGSMKVVWDWSDFAVNFENYVMPEQKIRRAPHATCGEPWPMPQYYVAKNDKVFKIDKANFHFKQSKVKCAMVEKAIVRYKGYILEDAVEDMYDNFQHAQSTQFEDPTLKYETETYVEAPVISLVSVKVRRPCARFPHEKMDESYDLFVKRTGIYLWANEVWGALRGLETLSQLIFRGTDQELYIKDTVVNDYPRFSHRGVLIDSSRHFIFKEVIYDVLEGMAQNKLNVLHWHLVDDQSFPYQSKAYPDLSEKGAFHPTFVYTPEDIADIINFARDRGIRVEPEFDTPGHTYSWGLSRPDLLTQCFQGDRPVDGYLGPMDPSKNETFRFLKTFFNEVLHTFKDQYIHLGGDEVPMTCWSSNPEILKFLSKLEGREGDGAHASDPYYYSYDVRKVLEYYVTRLTVDLKSIGAKRSNNVRFVFWQEIMNNNVQLPNDTIIQVWQGDMSDVQRATSLGYNVIYSTCWYLDLIEYGTKWSKYYQCDPADTTYGYTVDESKVLGGEVCLWAEYIDNENLLTTLWPRASAAAERLWSSKDLRDLDSAAARLQEHRCRMLSRGLSVSQISGPDYCLRRGRKRHYGNDTSTPNCTQAQCGHNEANRVEIEKIKVQFEQKGGGMPDCSQAYVQAGSLTGLLIFLAIIALVGLTLKMTNRKIFQVRACKNKTILMVFITLILVYFMCYTSIWMQAMEFKGSFEKRVSSNVQHGGNPQF